MADVVKLIDENETRQITNKLGDANPDVSSIFIFAA